MLTILFQLETAHPIAMLFSFVNHRLSQNQKVEMELGVDDFHGGLWNWLQVQKREVHPMFCFFWEHVKYFEASLILSGRCAPQRFEYFFMPQMFTRSSSACIKIPAKSSRNVYVLANKFTVGNEFYQALYAFSFYSHIWTTFNREVSLRYTLGVYKILPELGQQDHFS